MKTVFGDRLSRYNRLEIREDKTLGVYVVGTLILKMENQLATVQSRVNSMLSLETCVRWSSNVSGDHLSCFVFI